MKKLIDLVGALVFLVAAFAFSGCAMLNINNLGAEPSYGSSHGVASFRTGASLGGWGGALTETFGTQKATTTISPAWGGLQYIGINIGLLFVDWSPTYFGVSKVGASNGTNNAYLLDVGSFEAGLSLLKLTGFVPAEVFVGYDFGSELGFSTGTSSVFDGNSAKIGVSLPLLAISNRWRLGVRAELRDNFLSLSGAGPINVGVSSWSYYGGLTIMFSR